MSADNGTVELDGTLGPRVTEERVRALFGNAGPLPHSVRIWEEQFDQADHLLWDLARSPWESLFEKSFWAYLLDLKYVQLQPEIFRYLFPACLVRAQRHFMSGCCGFAFGDSDFFRSLLSNNWHSVATEEQIRGTYEILIDGFLDRIDQQPDLRLEEVGVQSEDEYPSRFGWHLRLNTLGYVLPTIQPLWERWWSSDSVGAARTSVEWIWELIWIQEDGESEDFPFGSGGRQMFELDAGIYDVGWTPQSLNYLETAITLDSVQQKLTHAVDVLADMPDGIIARNVLTRFETRLELVEERLRRLRRGFAQQPQYNEIIYEGWYADTPPYEQ